VADLDDALDLALALVGFFERRDAPSTGAAMPSSATKATNAGNNLRGKKPAEAMGEIGRPRA
jgi:hypothetical protein